GMSGRELRHQSALTPANFTTLPHFSVSSTKSLPKSLGEPVSAMPPRSANRAFILESATPASISLLSLSIISTGVFLGSSGAAHPSQVVTPQMGYSFLFDAKELRPRLTWLLASTPAFYEAYRQWSDSLDRTEPASSDRGSPNLSAP